MELFNVLPNRIDKFFDRIAKGYDEKAFLRSLGLRYLSYIELQIIMSGFRRANLGTIVDVGCGTGRIVKLLGNTHYDIIGVDLSKGMLNLAKASTSCNGSGLFNFLRSDASYLPFKSYTLSGLTCIRLLKYIPDWLTTLNEFSRVLNKGGLMVLEFSNKCSAQIFASHLNRYILFNYPEVLNALSNCGFSITNIVSTSRLPFFFYNFTKNHIELQILILFEILLNRILPPNIGSRNIMVVCKKIL